MDADMIDDPDETAPDLAESDIDLSAELAEIDVAVSEGGEGSASDEPHAPRGESEADAEQAMRERDEFKDIALRLQADFDNYRKRVAVQTADELDRATGRLAEALLPVLDAAEAAYVRHPDEIGPLLNLMLSELRKVGLETLDLQDKPFDPTVAEAVAHEPGDGGDPTVAEVMRSGYTWKGRTLRPAMVRTRG